MVFMESIEGIWLVLEAIALQCKPKVGENKVNKE